MTYTIVWTKNATKELLKIPKKQPLLILSWVQTNLDGSESPKSVGDGKPLQGTNNGGRWRVGTYQILGKLEDEVLELHIVRVSHRQDVYKKLSIRICRSYSNEAIATVQ